MAKRHFLVLKKPDQTYVIAKDQAFQLKIKLGFIPCGYEYWNSDFATMTEVLKRICRDAKVKVYDVKRHIEFLYQGHQNVIVTGHLSSSDFKGPDLIPLISHCHGKEVAKQLGIKLPQPA